MRQFALITFALVACLADNTYGEVQARSQANLKRDSLGISLDVAEGLPIVDNLLAKLTGDSSQRSSKDTIQYKLAF
ncbi:hypothetical protein A0J61_08442 [Choanephora cucurbitarum]|uniref:Uncharacterized protein n=1 Tax=Choanephora cucurbitarum TaxID=101091 RepID=A0A1C7N331_9FUNG|nr:hypothetical protein A0J61_08442 [Choanephora cucurbitarum]